MSAIVSATAEGKASRTTLEKPMWKVTWRAYNVTVLNLALKVYRSGWEPDYIVSIGRGGMPAGDAFSRMFKKTLGVIMASSYHGEGEKTQGDLEIAEHISITLKQLKGRVLLIDDLVDSGKTLAAIQWYIQEKNANIEIRTAVVYKKKLDAIDS
ncbi:MAG: phosphoribosyltransferase [Parachlamydia sp.]|nr:phosphoribosyltransferase [Parachlamydia sp.]